MKLAEEIYIDVTKEDFQKYWKKLKEKTASFISQLHFGHYKSASLYWYLSEAHTILMHIVCKLSYSINWFQKWLMVMVDKNIGYIAVEKLRAILLMYADFNMVKNFSLEAEWKRAEYMKELPTDNAVGRKYFIPDEVGL